MYETVLLLLFTLTTAALSYFFVFTSKRNDLPPMASGKLPVVGHSLAFFRDPVKLICDNNISNNGIFTLKLATRNIVLLCNPSYKTKFYASTESVLSHAEALQDFGFTSSLREDANELFEVMQSKLIKVNLINNVNRFVEDFAGLVQNVMRTEILKCNGSIPDIFKFTQNVSLRAVAAFYLGVSDITTVVPNFVELYTASSSRSFGLALVANVLLGRNASKLFLNAATKRRTKLVDLMEEAITKVLQQESDASYSSAREPYLTQFFRHAKEKAREAGREEVTIRQIADFAVSQIGSGAGGPTTVFAQLVVFLISSPARTKYLTQLKEEIMNRSSNTEYFTTNSSFLHNCIMETLRLTGHTLGSMRKVKQDWNVGDYTVPAGWFVGVSHVANSYDERLFNNARVFMPERWDGIDAAVLEKAGAFTPFSGGSHRCPGRNFGKLLVAIMMTGLIKTIDVDSLAVVGKMPPLSWKRQQLAGRDGPCSLSFHTPV